MIKKILLTELAFALGITIGNLINPLAISYSLGIFMTLSVGYLYGVYQFKKT